MRGPACWSNRSGLPEQPREHGHAVTAVLRARCPIDDPARPASAARPPRQEGTQMSVLATTPPARRRRALAVAGVAVLGAVAGCGSSSDAGGSSPSPGESSASDTPVAMASSATPSSSGMSPMSSSTSMSSDMSSTSMSPSMSAGTSSAMSPGMSGPAGAGGSVTVDGATVTVDAAAAAALPAAVKSKGTLTVAADASYAPNEFFDTDGKTVIGMDADLAKALGAALGLKVTVVNATFNGILPGLAAGKYDLGMSSITDTRVREKVTDFVTYFTAGTGFYTKTAGPKIETVADLCGHKVGAEVGTTQADDATAQDALCKKAGKSVVALQTYQDQNGVNLALVSGRADVGMADSPVAAYEVQTSKGQFALTGKVYGTAPYGIAVPKSQKLTQAVLVALKSVMKQGAYAKILAKWQVTPGALATPVVNGAKS